MRRSDSEKLRNLPKLHHESRLLQYWLARWLAQNALKASQRVHSCLPSSTHPPSETPLWELATAGQQHQPHQWSSPPQMDAHRYAPQGNPSWSSPLCCCSSSSLNGFPWKSSTRHPGVSRRRRWSRAKRRLPWKCRNTSWCPCVGTKTFLRHTRQLKWLGILPASDGPVMKNLPSSVAAYTFFIRKVSLDRILQRPLVVPVSSPLVYDVSTLRGPCDGPCFSLSSTSFSTVNKKTYNVHQTRKVFNQNEARNTNFSSMETAIVLSPLRKRSETRTRSDDQWHESQL